MTLIDYQTHTPYSPQKVVKMASDRRAAAQGRHSATRSSSQTLHSSGYNFAAVAAAAMTSSSQSLDYPNYQNNRRINQSYGSPAAGSPAAAAFYSPKRTNSHNSHFYWTARVGSFHLIV